MIRNKRFVYTNLVNFTFGVITIQIAVKDHNITQRL
jgi:hypothetical protein